MKGEGIYREVQRFRGGHVFKAHRLVYHPTLGLRVIKKEKKELKYSTGCEPVQGVGLGFRVTGAGLYRDTSLIRNSPLVGPYSTTMSRALWRP